MVLQQEKSLQDVNNRLLNPQTRFMIKIRFYRGFTESVRTGKAYGRRFLRHRTYRECIRNTTGG
jgi:hypothetical protein